VAENDIRPIHCVSHSLLKYAHSERIPGAFPLYLGAFEALSKNARVTTAGFRTIRNNSSKWVTRIGFGRETPAASFQST
jgi:hypothetical protein